MKQWVTSCDEDRVSLPPRAGCRCRQCYLAREELLDPELVALIREGEGSIKMAASYPIIRTWANAYLAGQITLDGARFKMIEALAKQCDKLFDDLNLVFRTTPTIFPKDE